MGKVISEKQVNSFVRGLITEASPLTFPENASLDEVNMDLQIDGSRVRRLGVDYETSYQLNATGYTSAYLATTKMSSHKWEYPGGATNISFTVVRIGQKLWFLNSLAANPSANLLNGGAALTLPYLVDGYDIETTTINGVFIIVGKGIKYPIYLEYNPSSDAVFYYAYIPQVRDIWGIAETLNIDERPVLLDNAHEYNLRNQGWNWKIQSVVYATGSTSLITPQAIQDTKAALGVYPSNADQWSYGKVSAPADANLDKYDANKLNLGSVDNSYVARGSKILNVFYRGESRANFETITYNRNTGLTSPTPIVVVGGLPSDYEQGSFTTAASYAGRVFYSGVESSVFGGDTNSPNYSGYVFFSQVMQNVSSLAKCYQENDPTSPNIPDLLDTDGGTIHIPEASKIVKLVPAGSSLLVLADNGVWEIFGDTGGFTATSYQVRKVTSVGILNPKSIVDANGTIVYWAKSGIFALSPDQTSGHYVAQNLSLTTIQTRYTAIPDLAKLNAKGYYDEIHNHIRWLYNSDDTYSETNFVNNYNKELNLDLSLSAFYIYSISSLPSNSPIICDYVGIPGHSISYVTDPVYVGVDPVQITSTDSVVIDIPVSTSRTATYYFLTLVGTDFTLSQYKDTTFHDWVTASGTTGVNYDSYVVTGYEMFGDMLRYKQTPYILFYFDRTETGFHDVGGNLELLNPSSCLVQAQWNWANSANSGKWGTQFQAYRLLRNYIPSGVGDPFDYGDRVIVTKNKLRGSGRALSLKIQSEEGKDMRLLGWATEVTGNSKP